MMRKIEAADAAMEGAATTDDDSPTAVVLDFAGQRMYYYQHHCELSKDLTLYIVAFSLAEEPSAPL
eukprot:SAG31_NODE_32075_length_360_cov_0.973180_2_plen_65_part_01